MQTLKNTLEIVKIIAEIAVDVFAIAALICISVMAIKKVYKNQIF